jgi:predicted ester cyclase
MGTLDLRSLVQGMYEARNAKDLQRIDAYAQPDCRVTNVPFGATLAYQDYQRNWVTAFPEGVSEVINLICEGDYVVAECNGRGTHRGPLEGPMGTVPPTNRKVDIRFVEIWQFRNGKIAAGHMYFDGAGFMAQLGIAPATSPTPRRAQAQPQRS